LGNKVTTFTDHQALVSAFQTCLKSLTKELFARWYLRLSRFLPNTDLQLKPGTTSGVADALSCLPFEEVKESLMDFTDEPDNMLIKQRKAEKLMKVIPYLHDKILPEDSKQASQFGKKKTIK